MLAKPPPRRHAVVWHESEKYLKSGRTVYLLVCTCGWHVHAVDQSLVAALGVMHLESPEGNGERPAR